MPSVLATTRNQKEGIHSAGKKKKLLEYVVTWAPDRGDVLLGLRCSRSSSRLSARASSSILSMPRSLRAFYKIVYLSAGEHLCSNA